MKTPEHPTTGGSYIRQPDGKLEKQPAVAAPKPTTSKKKGNK